MQVKVDSKPAYDQTLGKTTLATWAVLTNEVPVLVLDECVIIFDGIHPKYKSWAENIYSVPCRPLRPGESITFTP